MQSFAPPSPDCRHCPRLAQFRDGNRTKYPHFYNGAVPSFGDLNARLLIVGLAPGLQGANATGRPFTGDFAGEVLYAALLKAELASQGAERGVRGAGDFLDNYYLSPAPCTLHPASLALHGVRITNAVRCVPPENKPTPAEIKQCNGFLRAEIAAMPELRTILALGLVSHQAVLKALGAKASAYKFAHGAMHELPNPAGGGRMLRLTDSYHTSRYNINTGRLTAEMFETVVGKLVAGG